MIQHIKADFPLTPTEIDILKSKMPTGYYKRIKQVTGVGNETLNQFFRGVKYRTDIHEAILDIIESHQSQQAALLARSQKITAE